MSEKQTPQPVEKTENAMEIMEPKEAWFRLHTQEVRGSSPCAPTIYSLESIDPPFRKRKLTTTVHESVQKMVQLTFAVPEIPRSFRLAEPPADGGKIRVRAMNRFSRISAAAGKIQTGQEKLMRQPLESEPPQIRPASRLPGSSAASVPRSIDTATLDLLSVWQREDATSDPVQLKAAEEELAIFMKAVNEARLASGEPLVYP